MHAYQLKGFEIVYQIVKESFMFCFKGANYCYLGRLLSFFYVLKNQVQVRDAVMGHFSCAMSYINFLRNWLCLNNFFRSLFITILFQFTGKYLSFLTLLGLDPFQLGWFGDQINIMKQSLYLLLTDHIEAEKWIIVEHWRLAFFDLQC